MFVDGKAIYRRANDACSSLCPEAEAWYPSWRWASVDILLSQSLFCYQAFHRLDEAHPYWERTIRFSHLPVQVLILPPNTLSDMPRILFNRISGHPSLSEVNRFIWKVRHSSGLGNARKKVKKSSFATQK